MTRRNQWRLTIKQGETLSRRFRFVNSADGEVADAEADLGVTEGALVVKDEIGGTVLVNLTVANGGIELDLDTDGNGEEWSGRILMADFATAALEDWGDGVFDFWLGDGIHSKYYASGVATLEPSTTTP